MRQPALLSLRIVVSLLYAISVARALSSSSFTSTSYSSASSLVSSLITDERCFSTTAGAQIFADCCATNIVYEDCFHPQPFVGRSNVEKYLMDKVQERQGKGYVRLDKVSDGKRACGYAWTWVSRSSSSSAGSDDEEEEEDGLRGTTFVELNAAGEIQYVREIPEPIFKPGDLTLQLLKSLTEGATPRALPEFVPRPNLPRDSCDVVKYLFQELQGRDVDLAMELFSQDIIYRDFNYKDLMRGKQEVRQFIKDFSFPGIEFRMQRVDDGVVSTCFTWEVVLMDAPDSIKGVSFYELDPNTRLIKYVRDVPESAIKPPILGKLARQLRPGLGVFQGRHRRRTVQEKLTEEDGL
mmetsp:Transcript_8157/g.15353  ORF Transcript_8157/g.15353 Transcript_8157/m.15353 type:complete len:352 (+) Transcript_8157:181-1236(+)|eukprot:CAMPEP_0176497670 /NCGR_PEP_ID=MMETSP0200_2-20121128/11855_1 /TAXON_ID=947934 /ORGANISM="Chaetoceros sp., Strain GSL56" /LENGTH=351 /DNA_ID=CAMNT_0017895713 /DNA_START=77 /DNA_END=1132 /DNA_ORIENTATION=-